MVYHYANEHVAYTPHVFWVSVYILGNLIFQKIPSKVFCNIFNEMGNKIRIFHSILFVLISVDIRYIMEYSLMSKNFYFFFSYALDQSIS